MKKQVEIQVFDIPYPDTQDLERLVLADACVSPEMFGDIIPVIHPDMFTNDARRSIWETMADCYNKGKSMDVASIMPVIGKDFKEEVMPMISAAGGVQAVQDHAMNLRNGAAKRRAYFAAASFVQNAVQPTATEQEILTSLEAFSRAVEGAAPLQDEKKISEVLKDVKTDIEKTALLVKKGQTRRITTGFFYMDEVLNGGFKSGQLVILAARPSVGKTALMLQMAKAAATAGNPVQVFSLEMQADELVERMLYSTGELRPYQINHGDVTDAEFERAEKQLAPLPLFINDFSRSLDEIVTRLTQAVKQGRCKVGYIDYLGLMSEALNFGNAKLYQVIARITGTLKAVAKRLEIPIVLLCQMNREAAREGRAPELFDLRDSGSIEQDADVVMMLESKMASEGKLLVWLRKNRAGKKEVGFVLRPNDTYSAFTEENPILPAQTVITPTPKNNDSDDLPY